MDGYIATWILAPELSIYSAGELPKSAIYQITEPATGEVLISLSWVAADNTQQEVSYGGRSDGSRQESTAAGVSHVSFTRIDSQTLDSEAFDGDKTVSYARRSISDDGNIMSTVQEMFIDGVSFRNFQVYRRQI